MRIESDEDRRACWVRQVDKAVAGFRGAVQSPTSTPNDLGRLLRETNPAELKRAA